jgi:hypothetical protein
MEQRICHGFLLPIQGLPEIKGYLWLVCLPLGSMASYWVGG